MWIPRNGAPPATVSADGVRFELPFDESSTERLYWDLPGAWSPGGGSLIKLEFSVDSPVAIRSCLIYFESGPGWHVAAVPIQRPGRQRVFLSLRAMESEGRPGSWASVRRIRLSFWRSAPSRAQFVLHELRGTDPLAVVLIGDHSLPTAGERAFAGAAARRVWRWLDTMGLPVAAIPESEFVGDTSARVAILPYNLSLPHRVWEAIRRYARRGGRLIVCYSADPRLAELMGVRLGSYLRLTNGLQWTSLRFAESQRWPFAPEIYQTTAQILPVEPARADAQLIATWCGDGVTARPACVASTNGFWMTCVPNSDDGPAKQWLFAGMVALLAPEAWSWIAPPALEEAGRVDSFRNFQEAVECIRAAAPRNATVASLLDRAARSRVAAVEASARGDWPAFAAALRDGRQALIEAYARTQSPRPGERVGIWDHSGTGWYPGDWDRSCRELRTSGVTDVFPNLLWPAQAHFPNDVVPPSYTLRARGDQAAAVIAAARRHGLRVHLWKVCWNLEGLPETELRRLAAAGALQSRADGEWIPWLNPAIPANADRELAAITNAAARYSFDGIHLDYIRWPSSDADFGPATRRAFEQSVGRPVARWPADVRGDGPRAAEFRRWRAEVISAFVRRVRIELQRIAPAMALSAAVFADPTDCPQTVGQDWPRWLREGWVDFVCPMNYDENLRRFAARCAAHASLPQAAGRIWQGIGASANDSQLLADQVIEQVIEARRSGAAGFVLFEMSPEVREHVLPMLRLGVTAPPP
ncbi:MAG: family 10 glycosylhydrolase [Kiritimatiellae bacterium]|nr:family 10 glycosylhydrolase [Kiritimatiellia bacterium]